MIGQDKDRFLKGQCAKQADWHACDFVHLCMSLHRHTRTGFGKKNVVAEFFAVGQPFLIN